MPSTWQMAFSPLEDPGSPRRRHKGRRAMSGTGAASTFFLSLSVLATVVALAVHQVPQPWRGVLVGWLLFLSTIGSLALRVVRHHYEFRALQQQREKATPRRETRRSRRPRRRTHALKVEKPASRAGRRTIV